MKFLVMVHEDEYIGGAIRVARVLGSYQNFEVREAVQADWRWIAWSERPVPEDRL